MELNDYQNKAMTTCMESSNNFSYMMLNLVGELGEFASKVGKQIRKGNLTIGGDATPNVLCLPIPTRELQQTLYELKKEAGDILWQLAGLCEVMGWPLEEVAQMNLDKLQARKANGTIDGSGDGVTKEERSK